MDATKKTIEAALFMSGRWMGVDDLVRVVGTGSIGAVKEAVKELKAEYDARDGGVRMSQNGERFRLEVTPEVREKVYYLAPEPELSPALIKTLALIAYKQPIYQSAVVRVIGNRAYDYIKELRKKEFITIKKKGRTKLISTTGRFRKYFALQDGQDWRREMDTKVLEEAQKRLEDIIEEVEIDEDYNDAITEETAPGDTVSEDK